METTLELSQTQPVQTRKPRHYGMAQTIMQMILEDLPNIDLDPTAIKKWQLIFLGEEVILLATLDISLANPEKYERATHRIQTIVRSRWPYAKAVFVNSTGWRWAIRISRTQPLPKLLPLHSLVPGQIFIGQDRRGKRIQLDWQAWDQHAIVVGITRSGKSSFVRMVIYQAIASGAQICIADMKDVTFGVFEGHPNLVRPIARTPQEADALIEFVRGEIEHRKRLYKEMDGFPEKLSEYNQAAIKAGKDPLPKLLVVLDEYQSAVLELGGVRGSFSGRVRDVVRIGLAYGIHVILTAQDFNKEDLGGLRDQFGAVICFRTKNADTARVLGVKPAASIPEGRSGLAYCDPWGWVQTYFLDKRELLDGVPDRTQTEDEGKLFQAAMARDGRMTRGLIQDTLGVGERQARAMQNDLALRGWLVKDGTADNAFCVSDRWKALAGPDSGLDGVQPPTRPTASNPVQPVGQADEEV